MERREASTKNLLDEIVLKTVEVLQKRFNIGEFPKGSLREAVSDVINEKIRSFIDRQVLDEASASSFLGGASASPFKKGASGSPFFPGISMNELEDFFEYSLSSLGESEIWRM